MSPPISLEKKKKKTWPLLHVLHFLLTFLCSHLRPYTRENEQLLLDSHLADLTTRVKDEIHG